MQQLRRPVIIKRFFEIEDNKQLMKEYACLSQDERKELAALAAVELGVEVDDSNIAIAVQK